MPKQTSLFLLAGAAILFSSCSALQKNQAPAETTANASPTASAAPGNFDGQKLMAAFESGAALSCTMTNTNGGQVTFVTKDKKNRSTTTSPETPGTISYMINDGEYMYLWTSDQKTGFKTRIPTEAELAANKTQLDTIRAQAPDFTDATVQQEYASKGYTMNCEPSAVADSEFVVPTTVQFQDMSALMQKALEGMPQSPGTPADN